ncbi:5-formyltetrahydrofolate cyclo-ligase [uncultured Lactobacillus sp.]|uniref:5-formyltetrahydrofolate cyclo-ligase n=1 Tax=uncultured Lactobacillus sp. TaxID=153152 RepID=UPI00261ED0D4|nr:5-formyltetrahydrofolate cyclo-ligase [uncultured Lactobacillus sp.]
MNKIEFRKRQHKILKDFSLTKQKAIQDQKLCTKFLNSTCLKRAHKVGITISMPEEVDTQPIIYAIKALGKSVYIPRCLSEHKMEFTKFSDVHQLTRTKFGTSEIWSKDAEVDNDLDLIVVPLLAFEMEKHYRLGFGGGYYDRFLKNFSGETICLLNEKQVYPSSLWSIDDFDVPIQKYILAK